MLTSGNFLALSCTSVRSSFIKENEIFFDTKSNFISVEDYDFWMKMALNKAKFYFEKKFLGIYLKHENNLTGQILKHKKNYLRLLHFHTFCVQTFDKKNNLWKKIYSKYAIEMIIIYIFQLKNYKKGAYIFIKFIRKFKLTFIKELYFFFKRKFIERIEIWKY